MHLGTGDFKKGHMSKSRIYVSFSVMSDLTCSLFWLFLEDFFILIFSKNQHTTTQNDQPTNLRNKKMGRARISAELIRDKNGANVTYTKRITGINKKAKEMSVLCGCDIVVIAIRAGGELATCFNSREDGREGIQKIFNDYQRMEEENKVVEHVNPGDFEKVPVYSSKQNKELKRIHEERYKSLKFKTFMNLVRNQTDEDFEAHFPDHEAKKMEFKKISDTVGQPVLQAVSLKTKVSYVRDANNRRIGVKGNSKTAKLLAAQNRAHDIMYAPRHLNSTYDSDSEEEKSSPVSSFSESSDYDFNMDSDIQKLSNYLRENDSSIQEREEQEAKMNKLAEKLSECIIDIDTTHFTKPTTNGVGRGFLSVIRKN